MLGKHVEDIQCDDSSIFVYQSNDHTPYYNVNNSVHTSGVIRINNKVLEYFDSEIDDWMPLNGTSLRITLNPEYIDIINWARKKMIEDNLLEEKLKKYPSLKKAKDAFDIINKMTDKEEDFS